MREAQAGGHLEAEELAGYLEGNLAPAKMARVEEHLGSCDDCRAEAVEAFRGVQDARRRYRRSWMPLSLAAAALLVAVVAGSALLERGGLEAPTPLRGPGEASDFEQLAEIEVVSPVAGRPVMDGTLVFVWRAESADSFYRLTLTDDAGDILWRTSTSDTTVAPGPGVVVRRGATYYWIVDAMSAGVRVATSGARGFRISGPP